MLSRMRVLLVDDSRVVRHSYGTALAGLGFEVQAASSAAEALDHARTETFDVVLSDITMPEMNGVEFLKALRQLDLDLPVVLMTAGPTLDTAIKAVEYGAFRYLTKPIPVKQLEQTLQRAARYRALSALKRDALAVVGTGFAWPADRAGLEARFQAALEKLWIAFQPIVSWSDQRVHAYEALVRSGETSLARPADLLEAAERLGRLVDLGRAIRGQVVKVARRIPDEALLFINLHPADLNDPALYEDAALRRLARRVVLEITERASVDGVHGLPERLARLREMGFRLAIDDLGAGYAGLSSMTHIDPEYVKLDLSLVRDLHRLPKKQALVRSMAVLCAELGMQVIAEGVEAAAERDAALKCGCGLLQGMLFARPDPEPPRVDWAGGRAPLGRRPTARAVGVATKGR
jgi:EAL domain-containing protein (putative c-di-GMP-specific phosphodiesterase class I)